MKTVRLSFCTIKQLSEYISEVIVDQNTEIDDAMVDEYHACLAELHSGPFGLLVNKENDYTYTFSAQLRLATLSSIKAMAVLVYNKTSEIATHAVAGIPRQVKWNLQIFYERDRALQWLNEELNPTQMG